MDKAEEVLDSCGVCLLQSIPVVINGVRCGDTEVVATALGTISQSIEDMTDTLKLMQGSDSDI